MKKTLIFMLMMLPALVAIMNSCTEYPDEAGFEARLVNYNFHVVNTNLEGNTYDVQIEATLEPGRRADMISSGSFRIKKYVGNAQLPVETVISATMSRDESKIVFKAIADNCEFGKNNLINLLVEAESETFEYNDYKEVKHIFLPKSGFLPPDDVIPLLLESGSGTWFVTEYDGYIASYNEEGEYTMVFKNGTTNGFSNSVYQKYSVKNWLVYIDSNDLSGLDNVLEKGIYIDELTVSSFEGYMYRNGNKMILRGTKK